MDFTKFYNCYEGSTRGALHLESRADRIEYRAISTGEIVPKAPVVFDHSMGGRPRDIITTGWIGQYFEPDTWDGSDFFFPENLGGFFVTQRVVDVFKRYKIKNVRFEPITETENLMLHK